MTGSSGGGGSILQQYAERRRTPGGTEDGASPEVEAVDDLGCFGWLRGVRERAVMLELRKKTGTVLAVSYGWLERVEFDPSDGITLHVGGQKVRLRGRNLNAEARPRVRLFDGIARHKVPWVREADRPTDLLALQDVVMVEEIMW